MNNVSSGVESMQLYAFCDLDRGTLEVISQLSSLKVTLVSFTKNLDGGFDKNN